MSKNEKLFIKQQSIMSYKHISSLRKEAHSSRCRFITENVGHLIFMNTIKVSLFGILIKQKAFYWDYTEVLEDSEIWFFSWNFWWCINYSLTQNISEQLFCSGSDTRIQKQTSRTNINSLSMPYAILRRTCNCSKENPDFRGCWEWVDEFRTHFWTIYTVSRPLPTPVSGELRTDKQ